MTSSLFIILQQMLRISILGHKWSYYMFRYLKQFEDSSHAIGMCNSHVLGQLYVDWNRHSLLKWIFKIHQPPHKCTLHVLDTTGKFFIQSKSDSYLLTSIKHIFFNFPCLLIAWFPITNILKNLLGPVSLMRYSPFLSQAMFI